MELISVVNLEKYQPKYKDGRKNTWIRWDIGAMRDYKISNLPDNAKWLFVALVCLAMENKNQVPSDEKWIKQQIGSQTNHIVKSLNMLQTFGLIVKVRNEDLKSPSPTDIHTDITDNTDKTQNPLFDFQYLKDTNFLKTWYDFLAMRQKIRKPATDRAKEMLLKDLHKHDLKTALAMLEQSIMNAWAGVFALKTNKTEQSQSQVSRNPKPKKDCEICKGTGRAPWKDGKTAQCVCVG